VARDSGSDEGLAALDWPAIEPDLDRLRLRNPPPKLVSRETCHEIAALYPDDARFRSRIVMAAPWLWPRRVQIFRPIHCLSGSSRFAAVSIRGWRRSPIGGNEAMGLSVRYPAEHDAVSGALPSGGSEATDAAPFALRPRRLQLPAPGRVRRAPFSAAGRDPALRARTRLHRRRIRADRAAAAHAIAAQRSRRLPRATASSSPCAKRPVQGTRGTYRVNLRHGVSRNQSGERFTPRPHLSRRGVTAVDLRKQGTGRRVAAPQAKL